MPSSLANFSNTPSKLPFNATFSSFIPLPSSQFQNSRFFSRRASCYPFILFFCFSQFPVYDSIGRPHLTFIFGTRDHFCPLAMGTRLDEFMGRMVSPLGSRLASSWKQDSFVRWISRGFFTTLTQRVNWFPSKYRIGGRGEFRGVFCLVSIQSKLSRDSYT